VQQSIHRQDAGNRSVLDELVKITNNQVKLQAMIEEQQQQQIRQLQITHQRESIVYTGGVDDIANDHVDESLHVENNVSYATQQARLAAELNFNAFDLLLTSPRLPNMKTEFPLTWRELYVEWKDNDLQSFVKARQQEWKDSKLVQRYAKRHRAIKIIRRSIATMGNGRMNDSEVVDALDFERIRDGHSLSKHIHLLFLNDSTRTRRNRTPRNIINNTNH
jgi:hypothetical protein